MKEESKFKVGDITNKGTVDKIYSFKDISINGELYDLSKHNIKLLKEGQTQEPVKIFIADFAMKVLREKYSLDKEEFELMLRRKHGNFWNDYYRENEEKYISSLKQYPATWLTPEMDGKELTEGKDFELYDNADYTAGYEGNPKLMAIPMLTQEPVGGMKWEDVQILAKKHAEQIIEMGWRDNPDKDDIIADFISGYASAPPPAPTEQYEVYKEEKGMLHGWYQSSPIEYEKYPADKRRIVSGHPIKTEGEYEWGKGWDSVPAPSSPVGIDVEALKQIREAFQWTFDNMGAPHTSDHFNIPANGITALDDLIESASLPQSSTEEDESGFDKELLMMASWIDKIGVDNTAITRGAAKIKIGSALKRMLEYNSSSSVTGEESWKEVIINRISEFQKIYHANEAGRLTLALKAIEELIPPSYFKSLPVTGESEAIDWENVFENAQSMHLIEFVNFYKQSKK